MMFGKASEKKFLGLKGFHLNTAIGLIAGLDFLYRLTLPKFQASNAEQIADCLDMTSESVEIALSCWDLIIQGCHGRSLDLTLLR